MALGPSHHLTEMSIRSRPWGKKRPALRADNLAAVYEPNVRKCGSLTSGNPKGLHGLYRKNFTFFISNKYFVVDNRKTSTTLSLSPPREIGSHYTTLNFKYLTPQKIYQSGLPSSEIEYRRYTIGKLQIQYVIIARRVPARRVTPVTFTTTYIK
jgi:hypothetical protein